MSEGVEISTAAVCPTTADESASADPATQINGAAKSTQSSQGDDNDLGTASLDVAEGRCGTGAEDAVDGAAATGGLANDKVVARDTVDVGGAVNSASPAGRNSAYLDEAVKESGSVADVVRQPTAAQPRSVEDSYVTVAGGVGSAPAKSTDFVAGGDISRGSAGTSDHDKSIRSLSSSTVGRSPPPLPPSTSAARHALPSAVAAPRARGKHRLPPVLTTSAGHGQGHGLERLSPLSLVVGPHATADAVRASTSLTGGTRLGDLGLSQPPLNLSVAEEAVNMKVVVSTQRSSAYSGSGAGMYSTLSTARYIACISYRLRTLCKKYKCKIIHPSTTVLRGVRIGLCEEMGF